MRIKDTSKTKTRTTSKTKTGPRKKKGKMAKQLAKMNGTSKLEDVFEEILIELGEDYIKHYRFGSREFDFCLPDFDLLIEVHGCYWHGCKVCGVEAKYGPQKRSVKNDKLKYKMVESSNDYKLLTFWEHEIHKNRAKVVMELISALS